MVFFFFINRSRLSHLFKSARQVTLLHLACDEASSPIWASEAKRARPHERAVSRRLSRSSRASTFHDISQMKSLLAGYSSFFKSTVFLFLYTAAVSLDATEVLNG